MELNRNNFTSQQNQLADGWEDLFKTFGWQLILRRFEPRLGGTVGEMENAENPRDLGRVQGQRIILRELADLERIIEEEFRYAVEQAEPQETE